LKGFGVRQAHDYTNAPGGGQTKANGAIWISSDPILIRNPKHCDHLYQMGERTSGVKAINGVDMYCDLSGTVEDKGWTLVMKLANDATLYYDHIAWNTDNVLNADSPDATTTANAKYEPFNSVKMSYLRLTNMDADIHTVLQPKVSGDRGTYTLLELMQRSGGSMTTAMSYVSGKTTPHLLATDHSSTPGTCGEVWNINSKSTSSSFWIRIGGTFASTWGCNYGADSNNAATGAEGAGFGIRDNQWGPYVNALKGFGVRQAHDYTNAPGGGQTKANGAIWIA